MGMVEISKCLYPRKRNYKEQLSRELQCRARVYRIVVKEAL